MAVSLGGVTLLLAAVSFGVLFLPRTDRYLWQEVQSVRPLLYKSPRVRLAFSPDQFGGLRFQICFVALVLRSGLLRLGLLKRTKMSPLNGKEAESAPPNTYTVENGQPIALDMPFRLRPDHFRSYGRSVDAEIDLESCRHDPLRLHLLLTGLTLPSIVILTAKRGCPFDSIGTVHVRSRVEVASHDKCLRALEEELARKTETPGKLKVMSRCGTRAKKIKRGWEWVITCDLLDERGSILFRQHFVLIEFARHASPPDSEIARQTIESPSLSESLGTVRFTGGDPALWAALSKDKNPIHFSTLAAKALGLRGRVAHGYHVVAKGVDVLGTPSRSQVVSEKKGSWHEVEMKRPTFLPAQLEVVAAKEGSDGGRAFEIRNKDKVNVAVKWGRL